MTLLHWANAVVMLCVCLFLARALLYRRRPEIAPKAQFRTTEELEAELDDIDALVLRAQLPIEEATIEGVPVGDGPDLGLIIRKQRETIVALQQEIDRIKGER